MKDPCVDCPDNNIDEWGFLCNLGCGKRTAWVNYQAGVKEVVEWGLETCPHDLFGEGTQCFKRACDLCWQEKWDVS